jgi:hypothetical protein
MVRVSRRAAEAENAVALTGVALTMARISGCFR